ncbi:MAG: hypothetical protein PVF68_01600 [Acidobacteriota bacterium]|jgi:hypothetical protein
MMRGLMLCGLVLLLGAFPSAAQEGGAASAEEVEALRREVEQLRAQVKELTARLDAQAPPATGSPAPEPEPVPAPLPAPAVPPAAPAARTQGQNLMNPAVSAVFQLIGYSSLEGEDDANGFSLSEAEVALQSIVDPYVKMDLYLSFPIGESPEVEEGKVTTLSLPGSLQVMGGRFKDSFGKWNELHTHAFFTVDRPLVLTNYFGEESFTSDGVSLSVLIPNPSGIYLESTTQVGTALEGVSFNTDRRNLTYLEHLEAFFDVTSQTTLEVGGSGAWGWAGASQRLRDLLDAAELADTPIPKDELRSTMLDLDLTWKWKPLQHNVYHSFLWQTEVLHSNQDREFLTEMNTLETETVRTLGGYTYLEFQPARRWKIGARYDLAPFPDSKTAREWAATAVLKFLPSEFQEIRLQFQHVSRNPEAALLFDGQEEDNRILFEWIPIIGAHGAHPY